MQNRKPKIFFVMRTNDYSGAEAVNFEIIKNLRDEFDFYWVSRKGNINKKLDEEKIKWIEIKRLSISKIKKVVKEYNPDILHATDYAASVVCAPFSKKVPVISHIHNNPIWIKKININSLLYKYAVRRVSRVLVVSNSIIDEYVFSDYFKNKAINIGNPVSRNGIIAKVGTDRKKEYDICCVARVTPQKNPWKFLGIIEELKERHHDIKAVWVGKGEIEEEVKNYSQKHNLSKNIDFVGYKKNPWTYMAKSKIFMLTSDYEGYGLAAYEALSLGLPCVVSNVGGLPSIVTNKCGRLCNSKNDFVSECEYLLDDSKLFERKKRQAIKRSKQLENVDDYMELVRNLYRELYEN